MDPASLLGFGLVLVGVFVGGLMDGVSPVVFFGSPAAFLIVLVGALGAVFFSNSMEDDKNFVKMIMKALKGQKLQDNGELIDQIIGFAEEARRDGLLALEAKTDTITDPFFKRGLQLAIDGADPDMVNEVMDADVKAMSSRHKQGSKMVTSLGIFTPTFGIIGAVIGLIHTMGQLSDPAGLGEGIAGAFTATFWGVLLANGVFLPLGNKLSVMSAAEIAQRRLIMEGVLAIQSGANPRLLNDMLRSSLPPSERASDEERRVHKKKQHHEEHEEHVNHEAWVIPYADMLTLLMALFLVMWATGQTDVNKMKQVSAGFADSLGITGNGQGVGGAGVMDGASKPDTGAVPNIKPKDDQAAYTALEQQQEAQQQQARTDEQLKDIQNKITKAAEGTPVAADLKFRLEDRGLIVSIVTEGVLFEPGSADLRPEGLKVLDEVAAPLKGAPNQIAVEGHTDDRPISTGRFPSNWELSTARATSVLRYLIGAHQFAGDHLTASGYADTRPVAPGRDDASRSQNRRVDIAVLAPMAKAPSPSTTEAQGGAR